VCNREQRVPIYSAPPIVYMYVHVHVVNRGEPAGIGMSMEGVHSAPASQLVDDRMESSASPTLALASSSC